ncbi:MAG: hypothetical protein ACPL5I_07955 [Thermodesulfobacteriota bacterium]
MFNLKIRVPYAVHFSLELNHSVIWTPQNKDRGALLMVGIESLEKEGKGNIKFNSE